MMRRTVGILAMLLLPGCQEVPPPVSLQGQETMQGEPTIPPLNYTVNKTDAAELLLLSGRHYWSESIGYVCERPSSWPEHCLLTKNSFGFTVEGVSFNTSGDFQYILARVRRDDGAVVFIPYDRYTKSSWATQDPDAPKRKYCTGGTLAIGNTEQEAVRAWCFPRDINKTQTASGTSEQWVYPNRGYLYFENGILTVIQTHR